MTAFAHIVEFLSWTNSTDRAQRDIERCKRLVAELEGQS